MKRKVQVQLTTAEAGIGMGDVIAAVAKKLGIEECEGCRRRRKALNNVRWDGQRMQWTGKK